jgi:hypothetical protein
MPLAVLRLRVSTGLCLSLGLLGSAAVEAGAIGCICEER